LVSKKTDGVVTRFYWDGDALLGDVTGDDTREWVYYPGSFEPLVMVRNEKFYLYHNEPNGCPSRLLDESGKIVWAARYDAWGKVKKLLVDEVDQPLRLQGQYFDRETGLYYNRFRYYEPIIGTFISQDQLGLAAGENVYGFGSNAQTWVDPLGLCKAKTTKTWNGKSINELAEMNINNSGRTVLGHYEPNGGYISKAQKMNASYFDIGDIWNQMDKEERWAANTHFLDVIAGKGDQVYLSVPKQNIRPGSYLVDEINYLTKEKGYQWINQWSLVIK
jgi:RHS repeat-associated protein